MEPVAHAGCILKVDVQCDSCKLNVLEVLSSINGVYSVSIDAEEGVARVSGEVDPNRLLTALARSGRHAEVKTVNLRHPLLNRGYGASSYENGYGYGAIDDPYMYAGRRGLPEYSMCGGGGGYEAQYHGNVNYPIRGYGGHAAAAAAANPFYDVSSYQRYAAQAMASPFRYGHYNYC
ncbi:heavy metal-associated isoprenylated plant protein 32-like [Ipomoea triloba]|uniref:heavy metal-associated isoprenylated plant protein 32-like n=1 Tax=Ipomoea triloba TaxID=35885 RepID=UPI00125D2A4E|nr:heavy metal-associated isoprenylated plant protein 32-like [Ipomoea triloba]